MNIYFYKGKNLCGKEIEGLYRAENKTQVATMIKRNGYFVVQIRKSKSEQFINFIKNKLVRTRDISIFCRQFSLLLKAGIPIIDSLILLEEQTENKFVKNMISGVRVQIINGKSLTKACESYMGDFPKFFHQMLYIGESTGKLDIILAKLGDYFDGVEERKEKIKSSLIYPFILIIVTILALYFISVNILPMFINIFEQANIILPITTRIIIFICVNIQKLLILFFLSLIIVVVTIFNIIRTEKGEYLFCKLKITIPIIGNLNKKIICSNFLNYLCILQSSGISLLNALNICKKILDNKIYVKEIEKMIEGIKRGKSLSDLMSKKLFSNTIINMINIGEETGNLEHMLNQSSIYYEKETNITLERLLTLIEPLVILLMAIIIGFITISIIIPMFEIYNLVG